MTSVTLASQPFEYEVLKLFIGAFLGAGLALVGNQVVEWCKRRRDNLVAGNLALIMLKRQSNDFVSLRKVMLAAKAEMLKAEPKSPRWLQYKPIAYPFVDDVRVDLASLAFLLKGPSRKVFDVLALVELLYLSLKQTHESHNLTAEAIQVKMAATGLVTGAPFDVEVMAVNVGAQLVGKSISNADAFEMHFASDEKNYLKAMTDLRQILVARFSEEEVV